MYFLYQILDYKDQLTSWPFGPALLLLRCGRCFGAFSVLVQSVYRWGLYLRSLRDCRSPEFVRLRQSINHSKTSTVPKHQLCQYIDSAKPLTAPNAKPLTGPKYRQCHIIDSAKPLTAPKHWPCQNIDHVKTSTTPKHRSTHHPCRIRLIQSAS